MKRLLFTVFVSFILFSCSSDNEAVNTDLIGTWELSEVKNDPGDGSGKFTKVESDKILVFEKGNKITSNGSLCNNTIDTGSSSSGTYTLGLDCDPGGYIESPACYTEQSTLKIWFEIKGSVLYVHYPCIEGCTAKFIKR